MSIRNRLLPELWRGERSAWNPTRELSRMQRQMERLLDDYFVEPYATEAAFVPACDVEESNTHFLVTFDLPGVKKEDVKIDLQENQLTVSGERKHEHKEEVPGRYARERYYGSFTRSFALPSKVNADKVEANYVNGVLQIAIPKTEIVVGKSIPIKEGKLIESKQGKVA